MVAQCKVEAALKLEPTDIRHTISCFEKRVHVTLQRFSACKEIQHRAVVVGICRNTRTWQSQPVVYTTYSRATTFAPGGQLAMVRLIRPVSFSGYTSRRQPGGTAGDLCRGAMAAASSVRSPVIVSLGCR